MSSGNYDDISWLKFYEIFDFMWCYEVRNRIIGILSVMRVLAIKWKRMINKIHKCWNRSRSLDILSDQISRARLQEAGLFITIHFWSYIAHTPGLHKTMLDLRVGTLIHLGCNVQHARTCVLFSCILWRKGQGKELIGRHESSKKVCFCYPSILSLHGKVWN